MSLPGGNDIILVGYLGNGDTDPFGRSQVSVVSMRTGRRVRTYWGTSGDHDSPDEFHAPFDETYRITIHTSSHPILFVQRSPGDEWRMLAPWIAATGVGLALLVTGLVGLLLRLRWRYMTVDYERRPGPSTIEEWMAQPHVI